eukprot:COSAG02_NODE_11394_length_1732_cov_2.312309_1_plen_39_part_10
MVFEELVSFGVLPRLRSGSRLDLTVCDDWLVTLVEYERR